MTIAELIEELQKYPPETKVAKALSGGCTECNPYGFEYRAEVNYVQYYSSNPWEGTADGVVEL